MELIINEPAYFKDNYKVDDEVARFCKDLLVYFHDKDYSKTLRTIGISPIIAAQDVYDAGGWKEDIHFAAQKSCAIISVRIEPESYLNADSIGKIEQLKYIILLTAKQLVGKVEFDYDSFAEDLISMPC